MQRRNFIKTTGLGSALALSGTSAFASFMILEKMIPGLIIR
jgi:hypothetical protein